MTSIFEKEKTSMDIVQAMQASDVLIAIRLDIQNNYLSLDTYADHNGLTPMQAARLSDLAKEVFSTPHPDA